MTVAEWRESLPVALGEAPKNVAHDLYVGDCGNCKKTLWTHALLCRCPHCDMILQFNWPAIYTKPSEVKP